MDNYYIMFVFYQRAHTPFSSVVILVSNLAKHSQQAS